jgi:hypothetical protein
MATNRSAAASDGSDGTSGTGKPDEVVCAPRTDGQEAAVSPGKQVSCITAAISESQSIELQSQVPFPVDDRSSNDKFDQGSRNTTTLKWYLHPVALFSLSFIVALIYALIPSSSRPGALLQSFFWNIPGTAAIVEIFCICLPGISDGGYVLAYVLGYASTPIVQLIAISTNLNNNQIFSTLAITSSAVVPSFVFMYYVVSNNSEAPSDSLSSTLHDGVDRSGHWPSDVQITAVMRPTFVAVAPLDTFSSSITIEEEEALPVKRIPRRVVAAARTTLSTIYSGGAKSSSMLSMSISGSKSIVSDGRAPSDVEAVDNPMIINDGMIGCTIDKMASSTSNVAAITGSSSADTDSSVTDNSSTEYSEAFLTWLQTRLWTDRNASNVGYRTDDGPKSLWSSLFWFLPRFMMAKDATYAGKVNSRRIMWTQWLFTILFIVMYNGYYDSLCVFTYAFRAEKKHLVRIDMFFLFIVMGLAFRLGLKRVGLSLDKRKSGTASMYFFGEVMALFFYFTFYRVLFESVSSWLTFFGFQALHLGSEWVMYPLRGHETVFRCLVSLENNVSLLKGVLLPPQLDYKDFLNFLALDFGIRCLVMMSASVAVLLLLAIIDWVPWITNNLYQAGPRAGTTYALILTSVALELINAYAMHSAFFKRKNINIPNKIIHCFQRESFALISCLVAANLMINPVFAFNRAAS